jgi:glycosyltransferase involved in cell wall biosynthesis
MKIALVITGLTIGGAETQVVDLADQLVALGHEVIIISLVSELVIMPKSPMVRVHTLAMRRKRVGSLLMGYFRGQSLLASFKPDVVHSHMVHANIFSRLLRLTLPMRRLICTAHSTNEGGLLWMYAYRLTDFLAHMTTNVSQEAMERAIARRAVPARKVTVVYNGIDCSRFRFDAAVRNAVRDELNLSDSEQMLLAVGRFCEAKDYPNLLHAFAMVVAARNDCVLCIAGDSDGLEQTSLESLAAMLGLGQHVRFLGFRRDINALMSAADLFVLSSAWEGFPLVIGEAMACERIVVSTDAGGVREWIGESPLIVPIRDSTALGNALLFALKLDKNTRRDLGLAARASVIDRYSLSTVAARWEHIYGGNCNGCLQEHKTDHE